MKIVVILLVCFLYSCNSDESNHNKRNNSVSMVKNNLYYHDDVWHIKPVKALDSLNRFYMSRSEALNACPENFHLPDRFEWRDFINVVKKNKIKLENSDDILFMSRNFWTSSIEKSRKNDDDYKVIVASFQNGLKAVSNRSFAYVLCKKDKWIKKNGSEANAFYGTASLKKNVPSCKNKFMYLDYDEVKMLRCNDSILEISKDKFFFSSDTVDLTLDSTVFNLYFLPDCSFEYNNVNVMISENRHVFHCENERWHSLGYQKMPFINKGNTYDSTTNEWYKTVEIEDQIWMAENLRKKVPNAVCYNNDEKNCKKYGRLYHDYEDGLCPAGWMLPSEEDWNVLMRSFNNNGSFLRSVDEWFFDFKNKNDVGFTAYPAGWYKHENYYDKPSFVDFSINTAWLTSKHDGKGVVHFNGEQFEFKTNEYNSKYYIRCLKKGTTKQ